MACIHKETFDIYHNDQSIVPNGYFAVDEEIAYAIQMLNRKGYTTEWSCAGHPLLDWLMRSAKVEYEKAICDPESYIVFKEGVSVPNLPPEFFDDLLGTRLVIRKKYHYTGCSCFEISHRILDTMEQLYEWALELPDYTS